MSDPKELDKLLDWDAYRSSAKAMQSLIPPLAFRGEWVGGLRCTIKPRLFEALRPKSSSAKPLTPSPCHLRGGEGSKAINQAKWITMHPSGAQLRGWFGHPGSAGQASETWLWTRRCLAHVKPDWPIVLRIYRWATPTLVARPFSTTRRSR